MPYVQARGKKRKLKLLRLFLLTLIVIALGLGSVWTYNTFFNRKPPEKEPIDEVVVELEDHITRPIYVITNPFTYVNQRLEKTTINGVEINLVDLYTKYGILYYLAEPIDDAEIDAQFLDIYLFLKPIYKEMISRDYSSEKRIDLFGHEYDNETQYMRIMDEFAKGLLVFAEARHADKDPIFTRYARSFLYDDIRQYVMYKEPRAIYMRMQDKAGFITRYDRQIYIRMFKVMAIMFQDLYAKNGITYACKMCPIVKAP